MGNVFKEKKSHPFIETELSTQVLLPLFTTKSPKSDSEVLSFRVSTRGPHTTQILKRKTLLSWGSSPKKHALFGRPLNSGSQITRLFCINGKKLRRSFPQHEEDRKFKQNVCQARASGFCHRRPAGRIWRAQGCPERPRNPGTARPPC